MVKWMVLLFCFWNSFAKAQDSLTIVPDEKEDFFLLDEERLNAAGVLPIWGIYFFLNKSDLLDSNDVHILAIADYLFRYPDITIEVGVHTDCRYSASSSRRLTLGRAKAICNRLEELGIQSNRLVARGYDDTQPYVRDNVVLSCEYIIQRDEEEEKELFHQMNRRVELKVLARKVTP